MACFDETCINSPDNMDTNECRRIINCAAPLHCTCREGALIEMIGGCNLNHLKIDNKTSPVDLLCITSRPAISAQSQAKV